MSWFPPFSRGGAVRAASLATRSNSAPLSDPRMALSGIGRNQVGFALRPLCEQFGRRRSTHQTRVMDAHVRDFRNVTRGGDVAPEVPDHLVGIGEPLREEAAAVLRGEHAGIAPTHAREGAFVLL